MDFEDVFDDEMFEDSFDDERVENIYSSLQMEQFELEQPLISKKSTTNAFTVERGFINSKLYHDKFEQLPVNKIVQQSLYIETGRLLEFVDGQEQERMVAINARTGEFLVDNFERDGSISGTGFTKSESYKVLNCPDNVALIHNHSLNGRPSIQDILTYAREDKVKLSIIACHDGTLYAIYGVNPKVNDVYNAIFEKTRQSVTDLDEVKRLATTKLYLINEKLGERHKLMNIKCF